MTTKDRPETRYAWRGEAALAYQAVGDGPTDLLYLQGWISNVELNWDHPTMARFLRGLARGRRLIVADPRGVGCSERSSPHDVWPLEMMMEDLLAVLDAVGSERTALLTSNHTTFVACMFAATYPERVTGLVLYEVAANYLWSEETPWEWTEARFLEQEAALRARTKSQSDADVRDANPSVADDPDYLDWWWRYSVVSEAPGAGLASARKYMYTDIRPILSTIHVPTLVLVRPDHPEPTWTDSARFLAAHVAGAELVEIPGRDAGLWVGDTAPVLRAIDTFLAAVRREEADFDRILATVMVTDIVGSTERAAELGDAAWASTLAQHHAMVRALLQRYRGIEIDTAGDGFLATFDGPARAIRCARAIVDGARSLGLEVRIGLHTGECEIVDGKVGGIAVHIAARIGAAAGPSEILVSQTVKDLVVGAGLAFEDRGTRDLKGVPDRWHLYAVVAVGVADPPA